MSGLQAARVRSCPSKDSILLEQALAFSAGLCRVKERPEIIQCYPSLRDQLATWRLLDDDLVYEGKTPEIDGFDSLCWRLGRAPPSSFVIASSYQGHPIAFACACSRHGIPVTLLYENVSGRYADVLLKSGVDLVNIGDYARLPALLCRIDVAVSAGRYVVVLFDAPCCRRPGSAGARSHEPAGESMCERIAPWRRRNSSGGATVLVKRAPPTDGIGKKRKGVSAGSGIGEYQRSREPFVLDGVGRNGVFQHVQKALKNRRMVARQHLLHRVRHTVVGRYAAKERQHSYSPMTDIQQQQTGDGYVISEELQAAARGIGKSFSRIHDQILGGLNRNPKPTGKRNLVFKPVGDACNIRCAYCPTRNVDVFKIPDAALLRTMLGHAFSADEAELDVTIHGGEPLLIGKGRMRLLLDLVATERAARDKPGRTHLQTNGILLDREWAELFAAFRVAVGVSVDGTERIHDRHRLDKAGKGTYQRVQAGLDELHKVGLPAGVLFVLPDEPEFWPDVVDVIESGNYHGIDLEIKYSSGGSPYATEYGERVGALFARWFHDELPPQFSPNLFESILDRITLDAGSLCWVTGTCEKHLGISQRGLVTPCCDRLTGNVKFGFGSVATTPLDEIISAGRAKAFFSRARAMHPDCRECSYRSVCNGGCVFYRIGASGEPDGKDPMCGVYKEMFRVIEATVRECVA